MIKLTKSAAQPGLHYATQHLMSRMLNPICGLVQEIGFIKRNKFGARILTAGADLTGVHTLLNLENPGRGAYHTGGAGIYINEPMIKSLGESVERYAQLTAELNYKQHFVFASYKEMQQKYTHVLEKEFLDLFSAEQLQRKNFPYNTFDENSPLNWLEVKALNHPNSVWVPAQLLFVGYQIKKHLHEPWYSTAVTTGTAAHVTHADVLINSLLEIIQIDSAIGHWYSSYDIPEIMLDDRTKAMTNVLQKYDNNSHQKIRFFWLKNPDLAGISIACLLEKPDGSIPRVAVGLGASTSLNDALYKAYLEAVGVSNLSNILILKDKLYSENTQSKAEIYDIDNNVLLYGKGENNSRLQERFKGDHAILASDMPADIIGTKTEQLKQLIDSFTRSNKELLFVDLTNTEAKELNFYVSRVWCKQTLSLCFPSAPPVKHPRFKQYGGFAHADPHPYP